MEKIASENFPLLIGFILFVIALVAWLVYRNLKDEDEFEQNLDDPKRDLENPDKEDKI